MKNPKAEGRRPKEIRNPRAESDAALPQSDFPPAFWTWGDESGADAMVVHDNGPAESNSPQDLQERTAQFGEEIIGFAKKIPLGPVNNRIISQLVGAGTSVGANYCEADDAVSRKEFKQKIGTCRKESKETMFFLRMTARAEPSLAPQPRKLWREAKELNLIFGAIWRK